VIPASRVRNAVALAMLGAAALGLNGAERAAAQSGPSITLDRSEVSVGDPVIVSMYDFTGQQVTVAVCGNLGKRGSTDCNMTSSSAVYETTLSVRNITTETLSDVEIRGLVGSRFDDNAAMLKFDTPGPIEPGQTWEQTIRTKLPAPVIGRYTWTIAASGAGAIVEADHTMTARPLLLYVLVGFLVIDIIVLCVRFLLRGRRRRRAAGERTEYLLAPDDVTVDEDDQERVLIG
jgi:hypothetical protein